MKLNTEPIKNWFGFTRRERRSATVLLMLIIIVLLLRIIVPEKNIIIEDITASISDISDTSAADSGEKESSAKLFPFDPNTASFDTLIRLGFAEKEARTLIAYRNMGGKFRQASDIKKVYGIDDANAERLIPFIKVKSGDAGKERIVSEKPQKSLIELNSCDSAQLISLPGIGPVLSARIIKYRNLLGGFAAVNQLKEVYGLPPETFEIIKGRVFADTSALRRTEINSAGYKELSGVPYLENYEITSILKYRELKGRIAEIKDLTDNKLITDEKAEKVKPYISFR